MMNLKNKDLKIMNLNEMKRYKILRLFNYLNKRFFSFFLRQSLNLLLIFQLSVYPAYANLGPPPSQIDKAEDFNQKHVESLRSFIFGNKKFENYYRNHPLDVFALLGQTQGNSELQNQISELQNQISELEKKASEPENNSLGFEGKSLKAQIKALKSESRRLEKKKKKLNNIKLENLFVEIIDDAKIPAEAEKSTEELIETSAAEVKTVLTHSKDQAVAGKALSENLKEKLSSNSVYINTSGERTSFRFSFHDEVVQTFSQNIEWLVFFGGYLVFLEAPKVSQSKALLSFIDLRYFEQAIGKTGLPLFQIPIHYKTTGMNPSSFLTPEVLTVKESAEGESLLQINNLELSERQIQFLSSLQQLNFNTTVSLLKGDNSQIAQAYLKEIIDNYSENLSGPDFTLDPAAQKISLDTKQMTLKLLENRRKIGSAENLSGNYGQLNKLSIQLDDQSKTSQEFKDNLAQDRNFQAEVSKTYQRVSQKRSFWNRRFAFLNYLTTPQPLGSPEITKSLGLIANSVSLKKDTVKNRFEAFKEGLNQLLYPKKNRLILSSGVLLGAGAIAPAEVSNLALFAVSSVSDWIAQFGELISVTGSYTFAWVNPDTIYQTYFKGEAFSHFLTGLTALFGATLITIGSLHFSINTGYLIKNIKLEPVDESQNKVRQKFSQFISYMNRSRSDFFQALGNAEKKKLGVEASIGFDGVDTHFLFRTTNNLSYLYQALDSSETSLSLEFILKKGEVTTVLDFIKKTEASQSDLNPENQITLKVNGSSAVFINIDPETKLKTFFDAETNKLASDISLSLDLSGEDLHISGVLQNTEFTNSENLKVENLLKEIQKENKKRRSLLKEKEPLSENEIRTLSQALGELSLGYSSWSKTFGFLGLSWNWFFIGRHVATRPVLLPKVLYYSKYFKTRTEGHIPSVYNGGKQNRFTRSLSQVQLGFKNMKEFEEHVKEIEKAILKEVNAQAYLAVVKEAGAESKADLTALSPELNVRDIESKKLKIFYGLYQRELFEESVRAYLSRKEGGNAIFDSEAFLNQSDSQLKKERLRDFIENPDILKTPAPNKIRSLVELTAKEQEIAQKSRLAADNLITGFLKRVNLALENTAKNNLDPKVSPQMQRSAVSKKLLNDPESLARATRQQINYFLIDKPIEVLYTFIFLAGVDQGILKILHDQAFTEEAWFHLGRYAIWGNFFAELILDVLGGVWFKTQIDARLEETQGFDVLPNKEEVKKGFLSWIKKQFLSKDNSWWENQKYVIKIVHANLLPATILMGIVWAATLGRFDIELFLAGYLIHIVTPFKGLQLKIENTFEKATGYAYKHLIEKGVDLSGKDKKLIFHPKIKEYHLKESYKLRRKVNYILALFYNNPVENILQIFSATHTSIGSFSLVRLFTPGTELPTQYWSNFMSFLESKEILSSDFAEKCKSIFSNNRPDIK